MPAEFGRRPISRPCRNKARRRKSSGMASKSATLRFLQTLLLIFVVVSAVSAETPEDGAFNKVLNDLKNVAHRVLENVGVEGPEKKSLETDVTNNDTDEPSSSKVLSLLDALQSFSKKGFLHGGAADGSSGSCASGYQRYEGTCYRAYGDRKSYDDAKAKCAADGGRLVAPKTERLDTFIMGLVQANGGGDHWIGLDDRASEGVWTFSDGTQMQNCDFKKWAPGEPNNAGGQDCVQYWAGAGNRWDDDTCSRQKKFICQIGPGDNTGCTGTQTVTKTDTEVIQIPAPTCSAKANIIFIVDGSKSVTYLNFPNVLKFVLKLAAGFEIGPNAAKLGVYQYGSDLRTELPIGQYNTREDVLNAVRKIQYMNQWGTFTGKALEEAYKEFPAGDDAKKIVIIITDGKAMDREVLRKAAQDVKADGAMICAVGVGGFVLKEITLLASSQNLVFTATDFDKMDAIRDAVLDAVCEGQVRRDIAWEIDSTLQFLKESAVELVDNLERVKEQRLVGRDIEEDEYVAVQLKEALDALFGLEARLEKRAENEGSGVMEDLLKLGNQLDHIRDIAVPLELKEVPEF